MKTNLLVCGFILSGPVLLGGLQAAAVIEAPPPVIPGRQIPESPARLVENQRLYGQEAGNQPLVAPEVAKRLVDRFRATFSSPAAPRIVLYVNRELVGDGSKLNLTGHTESYTQEEKAGVDTSLRTRGTNTFDVKKDAGASLADRQTAREIERLFGRVFRNADAKLADQSVAVALLPDEPGRRLVGDQAAKDREALAKVADVAIEVLITSRNLSVTMISGDQVIPVPDIQVTAIRLKDAAIVGQASAADVLGKGAEAGRKARQYDVQEITEATALALMEDMLIGAK
ncbi:MAG: hypothetical protein RL324_2285 [Verrucomicrobiota bacterium]|jgi:hypothetical protein